MDAIAEVRVLSSAYQAEYGRSSGLQISGVTKSGTNQFHGSFYDIERNSKWNSNSWANVQNGIAKPVSKAARLRIDDRRPDRQGGRPEQPVLLLRASVLAAHHGRRRQPVPHADGCSSVRGTSPRAPTTPARPFPTSETRARVCRARRPIREAASRTAGSSGAFLRTACTSSGSTF